jgi:2-amino-4-hydroxy-6-hydroxymethyldihydropteridine diphosphokinase
MQQRYTVSLGSNVRPAENMAEMLSVLLDLSNSLLVSKIICTEPVGMDSEQVFFNTAVCLDSSLPPKALKERFNQIETDLGRDRRDPLSKVKDRPADIDIVAVCGMGEILTTAVLPPEPYVRPLVLELWQRQGAFSFLPSPKLKGVPVQWRGRLIGLEPVHITADPFAILPLAPVLSIPTVHDYSLT